MLNKQDIDRITAHKTESPELKYLFEKLNEEHNNTLSHISHDLRNILTPLVSTLQYMESKNPELKDLKFWTESREDVRKMRDFLEKLSEYYNSSHISAKPFQLNSLLEDVLNHNRSLPEFSRNISVEYSIPADFPRLCVDGPKLFLALDAVIKNALDAIESENGKILIVFDHAGEYYRMSIKDNGCGIPENKLSQVFDAFVSEKKSHIGLGLSIANSIILAHGGYIDISSKENDGTCVSFYLPAALSVREVKNCTA